MTALTARIWTTILLVGSIGVSPVKIRNVASADRSATATATGPRKLARLRADGLVSTRREGKAIYYKLASEEARIVIGAIYDVFCRKARKR